MHLIAQYRQFATDYRRLAAIHTKPADKQALELFATGWDRAAEKSRGDAPEQRAGRTLINRRLARVAFAAAIAEKPAGRFIIRSRTRVVKRHPEGDW
jgi:hypothetical protein